MSFKVYKNVNQISSKSLVKGIKILLKKKKKKQTNKQDYGCKHYKNRSKDKKQRLIEYIKSYYKMWKGNCKVAQ